MAPRPHGRLVVAGCVTLVVVVALMVVWLGGRDASRTAGDQSAGEQVAATGDARSDDALVAEAVGLLEAQAVRVTGWRLIPSDRWQPFVQEAEPAGQDSAPAPLSSTKVAMTARVTSSVTPSQIQGPMEVVLVLFARTDSMPTGDGQGATTEVHSYEAWFYDPAVEGDLLSIANVTTPALSSLSIEDEPDEQEPVSPQTARAGLP